MYAVQKFIKTSSHSFIPFLLDIQFLSYERRTKNSKLQGQFLSLKSSRGHVKKGASPSFWYSTYPKINRTRERHLSPFLVSKVGLGDVFLYFVDNELVILLFWDLKPRHDIYQKARITELYLCVLKTHAAYPLSKIFIFQKLRIQWTICVHDFFVKQEN